MNIIVSGASSGIGYLLARKLLLEGNNVGINYCENSETAINLSYEFPGRSMALHFDVRSYKQVICATEEFVKKFGSMDVFINNAGCGGTPQFFIRVKPEIHRKVVETNLIGTINCTQIALSYMLKQEAGLIINISSVASTSNSKGLTTYAVTKCAIEKLAQLVELEVRDKNIRVISMSLPPVKDIGMLSRLPSKYQSALPEDMLSIMASGDEVTKKIIYEIENWTAVAYAKS